MKLYFKSKKETSNFKKFKSIFKRRYGEYIDFANFNFDELKAINFLPPKIEDEFQNKHYQIVIDFINIQLPTYLLDKDKDGIKKLLNDLYATYLQKFIEANNIWEIFE